MYKARLKMSAARAKVIVAAVVGTTAVAACAAVGASAATSGAQAGTASSHHAHKSHARKHKGTWMVGPGCGQREWLRHPSTFHYFCDGSAFVEKAHWRHWGKSKAKAKATFDEAVLTSHNSVATAPRRRSAVTVVASHIELCGGRRTYTSVVIRFDKHAAKQGKLTLHGYLPSCSKTH